MSIHGIKEQKLVYGGVCKDGAPVGLLGGGIKIIFLHYKNFQDASSAWYRRINRTDWHNIYIVLVEKDEYTYKDLITFDNLPLQHKAALVHKQYKDIKCARLIKGFENNKESGNIMKYKGICGRRTYDDFDWIAFLNLK